MLRRGFLKQFLTASTLACIPFGSFLLKRKSGIAINNPNLEYLHDFSVFGQLDNLLKENGISAQVCIEKAEQKNSRNRINLAVLNSSYGRLANFKFEDLKSAVQNNPDILNQVFIKTAGPSGKKLSSRSSWKIISKNLKPKNENVFFVSDAYPHYYNYLLLTKFGSEGSYFIDGTSRKPLYLTLKIQDGADQMGQLNSKFTQLKNALQADFSNLENRSMAFIMANNQGHSFEELLALAPAKFQGLNFKA